MLIAKDVNVRHPTIQAIEAELSSMWRRLHDVLAAPSFEDRHFVEIAAIFNNVSYLFLYLESNSSHIEFEHLLPWRDRFFSDPCLDVELLRALDGLSCGEADVERSREAYTEFLREKLSPEQESRGDEEAIGRGVFRAKAALESSAQAVSSFLQSLNITVAGPRPDATFFALASRTETPSTRRKLYAAWRRARDVRLDDLATAIDEVVRARWVAVRRQGYDTVACRTFQKCGVSIEEAERFLGSYVSRAVESQLHLFRTIGGSRAPKGASMDEFGHYLLRHYGEDAVPLLDLDSCLNFALDVARCALGLEFERFGHAEDEFICVDVRFESHLAGRIHFDLWAKSGRVKEANFTRGIRNRTAWNSVEQVPVAHVSCRFHRSDQGRDVLNFQNVHSLFHEFGHALNHLFIRRRMPNQSGLEYLPIERLETLSMWFEKWVYHREFAECVSRTSTGVSSAQLELAQEIKMLEYRRTHLDRAVTSAIDLMIHHRPSIDVRAAFRYLDDRFGIDEWCDLGAILPGFTWPMMQSNPGAYFAYLWGAGKSAEMFRPFLAASLSDAPDVKATWRSLGECFEFDHPSVPPSVESAFSFYGG